MVKPIENADMEPIRIRKAILWGREDLLSQAVGHFLKVANTVDVVEVSSERGVEELIREIRRINPEVVILCQDKTDENSNLPLLLINQQLCLKVITVELESNRLQVYSRQNVVIQKTSDLLSIVESGYIPNSAQEKEVGSKKQNL